MSDLRPSSSLTPESAASAQTRGGEDVGAWSGSAGPLIAYFVQDVSDPAVRRRVEMLHAGGGRVYLAGFRRSAEALSSLSGAPVADLGRTYDARLFHRALKTLLGPLGAIPLKSNLAGASAVIARNLEMLLLVQLCRPFWGASAPVYYEVLDVHRVMLRTELLGRAFRAVERLLMTGVKGLIVSSPAFEREYFRALQNSKLPVLLIENKTPSGWGAAALVKAPSGPEPQGLPKAQPQGPPQGPPWRIAWYGKIRCQKSLDMLDQATRGLGGRLEVDLRGQPAFNVFRDFDAQVAANPALRFAGPYVPADLPALYGRCHFVWGIDYYEENQNSRWLLPNRLYEGGSADLPILALEEVETGRWLAARGAGVLLKDPPSELPAFFNALTADAYERHCDAALRVPRADLSTSLVECRTLVERICG